MYVRFDKGVCKMPKSKEWDDEKIRKFEEENKELLQNNLVISFLNSPSHKKVYREAISNPTPENKQKLDILFKQFYFKIRFISHISTTLKFNSINYDKRERMMQSRYAVILDAPLNREEGEGSVLDLIVKEGSFNTFDDVFSNEDILEQVTNPKLYEALNSLSDKQKQIINFAYVEGLSDTEIALILNKSQQVISKTHKKALEKILKYIEEN